MANLVPYSKALARLVSEARAGGAKVKTKGSALARHAVGVVGSTKAVTKEGVSLGTHASVALLDNHVKPVRIPFTTWTVRPSTIAGVLAIFGIAFTKGGKRDVARSAFAGVLHRKLSTVVDGSKATIDGVIGSIDDAAEATETEAEDPGGNAGI